MDTMIQEVTTCYTRSWRVMQTARRAARRNRWGKKKPFVADFVFEEGWKSYRERVSVTTVCYFRAGTVVLAQCNMPIEGGQIMRYYGMYVSSPRDYRNATVVRSGEYFEPVEVLQRAQDFEFNRSVCW